MPLYDAVTAAANDAFAQIGVKGYLMCHLSHSYHAGACLYFTFAFKATSPARWSREYEVVKSAIQQAFVDNGAHALASPRGRHRARPVARAGHLRARGRDARGAVRRDRPRAAPESREDRRSESSNRRGASRDVRLKRRLGASLRSASVGPGAPSGRAAVPAAAAAAAPPRPRRFSRPSVSPATSAPIERSSSRRLPTNGPLLGAARRRASPPPSRSTSNVDHPKRRAASPSPLSGL